MSLEEFNAARHLITEELWDAPSRIERRAARAREDAAFANTAAIAASRGLTG